MPRPISNPATRFDPVTIEWFEGAPPAELQVFEDASKSVLSSNDSPDVGFTWSCNPYRGCQHACAYCYARITHEYLSFSAGTDFETKIMIKPRAAELLTEAFERPSWKGEWIAFSGNVDCYQPLEAKHRLTRACLEVCLAYRNPCGVITRSAVIERDLDLLAELHREVGLSVTISIPFHDAAAAKLVEPFAPAPARRFQTIARLAAAGIPVGVNIAPVIPGLTDHEIPKILIDAREAGATRAHIIMLRLPGAVKQVFEERIRAGFPDRADAIFAKIRRARGGELSDPRFGSRMVGNGEAWKAIEQLFDVWKTKLGFEGHRPQPDHPSPFRRPGRGTQLGMFG
jgi:DNA repair photolyase